MFSVPTVFIIGAGAGVDIGMPVGSKLSLEIAQKLDIRFGEYGSEASLKSGDPVLASHLRRFARARNEDFNAWRAAGCTVATGVEYTQSIDAYLNTHQDNEKVKICAKLAITQAILEHEKGCALYIQDHERGWQRREEAMASWLRRFFYILQDGIVSNTNLDRIFDNLCIINFNYDRCIEHLLFHAIQSLYLKSDDFTSELMSKLKIFHPYGLVGYLWGANRRRVGFGVTDYGDLIGLSEEIRTFNEQIEGGDELKLIRDEVLRAERIVFLGCHFHQQNMDLLKEPSSIREAPVFVYATGYERSNADIGIIQKQIVNMLGSRGNVEIHLRKELDCVGLFKEFGNTLMR